MADLRRSTSGARRPALACAPARRSLSIVLGCALLVTSGACQTEQVERATAALRPPEPPGHAHGRHKDAGVDAGHGASDAGMDASAGPTDAGVDAGHGASDSGIDASAGATDAGPSPIDGGSSCVAAQRMWFDDFETGDYSRWTGGTYDADWGNDCQSTSLSTDHPHAGVYSEHSDIVCRMKRHLDHRGYGGVQFSGDVVLAQFTNTGSGMAAPYGIVTTFWEWLEAGYSFGGGTWVSLLSVFPTCDYTQEPMTLGLDQPDNILRSAHWWPEGTSVLETNAPPMPEGRWVRITVYLSFETGVMHTWQDGVSVEHVTGIVRQSHLYCQWHWGLYASGDNDDVVLYEDDKVIWRLLAPWTDFTREPWLAQTVAVCPH